MSRLFLLGLLGALAAIGLRYGAASLRSRIERAFEDDYAKALKALHESIW